MAMKVEIQGELRSMTQYLSLIKLSYIKNSEKIARV